MAEKQHNQKSTNVALTWQNIASAMKTIAKPVSQKDREDDLRAALLISARTEEERRAVTDLMSRRAKVHDGKEA